LIAEESNSPDANIDYMHRRVCGSGMTTHPPGRSCRSDLVANREAGGGNAMKDSDEDAREKERPDWRSAESYKDLLQLDREGWAWIWLKRNPDYTARLDGRRPLESLVCPGTGVTVIPLADSDDASAWGLRFRRNTEPSLGQSQAFLATGLGCLGAGG
jgi:hypothetical protein